MSRKIKISVGEFYHIYNRGVDKRKIFLDDNDRKRFYQLLFLCNGNNSFEIVNINLKGLFDFGRGKTLVDIGVVCLMDNHFHLLLYEKRDNGISEFMHKLSTAYTMYFNRKYERTGSLFGGRFKAEHIDNDRYLKYLFTYIHLNPVKMIQSDWKEEGIKNVKVVREHLVNYPFSSYFDYSKKGRRLFGLVLNKKAFPQYFSKKRDFRDFINDWLKLAGEEKGG